MPAITLRPVGTLDLNCSRHPLNSPRFGTPTTANKNPGILRRKHFRHPHHDHQLGIFENAVGRDTAERAAIGLLVDPDDRSPGEPWADLIIKTRDTLNTGQAPSHDAVPSNATGPEIDDGADIGW